MRALQSLLPLVLAACACCASSQVFAVNKEEAPGYREIYPDYTLQADQLSVLPAKSRKGNCSYGETNALVSARLSPFPTCETNALVGVRRVHLSLGTKIEQKNTTYGVIGGVAEYSGIKDWKWLGMTEIQPDLVSSNIGRKTRYITMLDGRYAANASTGVHVGFYTELGMRASLVNPLVGIDYTLGPWLFQAVFPIKYGISYQGLASNVFSLMVRPFYTAIRTHKGLEDHPAVAVYKGTGAELRWDFLPTTRWDLWATAGRTLGSTLTIGDKHNNHRHHIHLNRAPYFNVGVTFKI